MSFFERARPTAIDKALAAETAAAARRAPRVTEPERVFVELGEAVRAPQIVREGVAVPPLRIDESVVEDVLAGGERIVTKVVAQSVAAGTAVEPGTSVDVVLAQPRQLPVSIIRDAHVALAGQTIGDVYDNFILNNAEVRRVVVRNQNADTLSDVDRGVIQTALESAEVPVSNEPGQTVEAAFGALQAAFTFGAR
jgi:hypothetical protein